MYKHDIRRFVDAMLFKLERNAHKGRWEDCDAELMHDRMIEEAEELWRAIKAGNMVDIMLEAADVANFALIISALVIDGEKE